jgi:hypothetical protein
MAKRKIKTTNRARRIGSDLKRVDSHVIQPHEYEEIPELTADQLARAVLSVGGRPVAKAKKRG